MNIAATGTTRANRLSSKKLSALKVSEKTKDHVPWGTVYARRHKEEDVMQFGFKDNAFVLLLSTAFDGWEPKDEKIWRQPAKTSTSARTAREPFQGQPTKQLEIPHAVNEYNHHMNGVDIGDQLRSQYTPYWRMRRGGQQALLYLFLFGVIATNCHLLQSRAWLSPEPFITAFRKRLCSEILNKLGAKVNAGERAYERTNFVAARVDQERSAEILRLLLFEKAKLAVGLRSVADSIATTTQDSHRMRVLWLQSL